MAARDSNMTQEATARQLTRAILRTRPELDPKLQEALTSEVAWSLAVLIASWRATEPPLFDLSRYRDVVRQFDLYADTLLRFREAATGAKNDFDLAGASGLFQSAVSQIGPRILRYVLASSTFAQIEQEILAKLPPPAHLALNAEEKERGASRNRRFLGFDYRPRSGEPPAAPVVASAAEVVRWQAELKRKDLPPEMRWLYEQKLLATQKPGYPSAQEARASWQRALGQARNLELRSYFAENLKTLERV